MSQSQLIKWNLVSVTSHKVIWHKFICHCSHPSIVNFGYHLVQSLEILTLSWVIDWSKLDSICVQVQSCCSWRPDQVFSSPSGTTIVGQISTWARVNCTCSTIPVLWSHWAKRKKLTLVAGALTKYYGIWMVYRHSSLLAIHLLLLSLFLSLIPLLHCTFWVVLNRLSSSDVSLI